MAASAETHDGFRHQQLPHPQDHFRLLRVIKCDPRTVTTTQQHAAGVDLECELTTWPLVNAPTYRCVSYTWGDPKDTTCIRVNGRGMRIWQNCKDVLRQFHWHSGADRYIWVDAICINQTDPHEKNIQVAMMGAIYQKAELVLACLGAHDEYSRALIKLMKQNSELFEQASKYYSVLKPERKRNRSLEWKVRKWHIRQDPDQFVRMFFEFLCRPYFKRAWTFPEMRLARRVEVICGDDCVPASVLTGLSLLVARGLERFKGMDDETIDDIIDNPFSIHNLRKAMNLGFFILSQLKVVRQTPLSRLFPLWRAAYGLQQEGHEHLGSLAFDGAQGRLFHGHLVAMTMDNNLRDPLWDVLQFTIKLQCENPRDRIYALLAIVDWSSAGVEPIQPDYAGDVYDLLKAVVPLLWSFHESNLPDAGATFNQCRIIIDALQLEPLTSPKLARSFDLRRRTSVQQVNSEAEVCSMPKKSVVGFRGFQIISDGEGKLGLDVPPHWTKKHQKEEAMQCLLLPARDLFHSEYYAETGQKQLKALTEKDPEQFHVVFDKYDRICALLPHDARPGDWITGNIEASVTLILREQTNSRYHVIGEPVVALSFFHCLREVGISFLTSFDIDDFIALCAVRKKNPYLHDGDRTDDVLINLRNGVCHGPGSSYAVKQDI
ncbi:heterokaryon incompatibility protein-domain-containing protein [Xylaria sp. FL0933]|nr:heterokaryon incompatibility protein-domain-containing protein [Xylaria sp. FL0933]